MFLSLLSRVFQVIPGRNPITVNIMTMDTVQIRLTERQVTQIDKLVKKGLYPSRSEAVRDAVRKLVG
jgi:hypothetical protein